MSGELSLSCLTLAAALVPAYVLGFARSSTPAPTAGLSICIGSACASLPGALVLTAVGLVLTAVWTALRDRGALSAELSAEKELRNGLALDLMGLRNKNMHSAESVRYGQAMVPRKSDVFVVTYPKCGTTWMTQLVHMLRTNGDMDFGEITEVVPWDILAYDCGQDLSVSQVAEPRAFKSHGE
jgi:multisubunit Na+/H+ antiporter MnhC subunit